MHRQRRDVRTCTLTTLATDACVAARDDLGLMRRIVDDVKTRRNIDARRVYSTGQVRRVTRCPGRDGDAH
jgi:poly(3-hydroxybutyrate) depolymerase